MEATFLSARPASTLRPTFKTSQAGPPHGPRDRQGTLRLLRSRFVSCVQPLSLGRTARWTLLRPRDQTREHKDVFAGFIAEAGTELFLT
ncbi:hypothetical protein NDU88_006688 [Pleurodeles waltl]|uniref:Uncharacterized protein n=1 Tax=Pleurodeles waltl TaxID=8319 RepID=A0AAV7LVK3_PLEWA|nr:hypothetical protein NDU88_006688 [Pleurodeles waltl]